jgi:hypothetical protein
LSRFIQDGTFIFVPDLLIIDITGLYFLLNDK